MMARRKRTGGSPVRPDDSPARRAASKGSSMTRTRWIRSRARMLTVPLVALGVGIAGITPGATGTAGASSPPAPVGPQAIVLPDPIPVDGYGTAGLGVGRHCAPGLHALALRRRGHRRHQLPGHPARRVGPRSHQRSRGPPDPRRRVRRRLLRPVRRIGEQRRPTRRDARRQRVEVDQRGGAPVGAEGALPPAHGRNADRRRARSDAGARRRLPRWSPPRRPSRAPRG